MYLKLRYFPAVFLLLLNAFSCQPSENAPSEEQVSLPTASEPFEEITIDLTELASIFTSDTLTIETNNDPVFKRPKKYLAYALQPILTQVIEDHQLDIYSTELIFSCTDGYKPSNLLQHVMEQGRGYLAFKDLDAPEGESWLPEYTKKFPPFYLIWEGASEEDELLAWPYGLFQLTFKSTEALFSSIYPTNQPALEPGFELFKRNCMKCHSINKIGGIMGPEFNFPTNITTYWKREHIIAYAKNPQSYRYNSKMPAVVKLNDQELNLIVDYLTFVAERPLEIE